jgi:preprotein translocase subunit YajC
MLDFFVSSVWAAPAQQEPSLASFLPLVVLFAVFYFLLIRPQLKQAKQHKLLVSELTKGDEVATSGGLLGKIKEVGDNFVAIEIAKDTEVKVQKQAITTVLPKGTLKTL